MKVSRKLRSVLHPAAGSQDGGSSSLGGGWLSSPCQKWAKEKNLILYERRMKDTGIEWLRLFLLSDSMPPLTMSRGSIRYQCSRRGKKDNSVPKCPS